jgi:hypothetical protein
MRAKPKLATTAKTLATLTLAVFLALFITNMTFQVLLNRQEKKRNELIDEINKNSYVEEQIRGISSATNLYKETVDSNPDISEHLSSIVGTIQDDLTINSIDYDREHSNYEINLSTNSAPVYASMLSKMLNIEQVDSVVVDFVSYKPVVNRYTGNFIINLK